MKGLSSLLLMPLFLTASSPKMRIGYYGHAFFEVVMPSGLRVAMDPFDPDSPYPIGLDFPYGIEAELVVITHTHPDHRCWWRIEGSPDVFISSNGSARGVDVYAHPTKHGPGSSEGDNYIMAWENEGLKFAEMGGYGDVFSPEDSAFLEGTDFLFFPVGSYYAMDANLFNPIIDCVSPSVGFPEHYKTPDHNPVYFGHLLTIEEANELLIHPIVTFDDAWIAVDLDELPEGPVLWEPAYSPDLPGDLALTAISTKSGSPCEITVEVFNNSQDRDAEGAPLFLSVYDGEALVYTDSASVNVAAQEQGIVTFESWTPSESKQYTLFAEVTYPADDAPQNDTATLTTFMASAVDETQPATGFLLETRRLSRDVMLIEYAGSDADLTVYDVTGTQIDRLTVLDSQGPINYTIDHLPEGLYFVRLTTSQGTLTRKFTVIR
ncbi:MBL fold metallo-hydrolase [candidate division WOR-3 bacterium]|nr:MBL fold metallo-hydrolase [candidate division WOR-3 bacterium]